MELMRNYILEMSKSLFLKEGEKNQPNCYFVSLSSKTFKELNLVKWKHYTHEWENKGLAKGRLPRKGVKKLLRKQTEHVAKEEWSLSR